MTKCCNCKKLILVKYFSSEICNNCYNLYNFYNFYVQILPKKAISEKK